VLRYVFLSRGAKLFQCCSPSFRPRLRSVWWILPWPRLNRFPDNPHRRSRPPRSAAFSEHRRAGCAICEPFIRHNRSASSRSGKARYFVPCPTSALEQHQHSRTLAVGIASTPTTKSDSVAPDPLTAPFKKPRSSLPFLRDPFIVFFFRKASFSSAHIRKVSRAGRANDPDRFSSLEWSVRVVVVWPGFRKFLRRISNGEVSPTARRRGPCASPSQSKLCCAPHNPRNAP